MNILEGYRSPKVDSFVLVDVDVPEDASSSLRDEILMIQGDVKRVLEAQNTIDGLWYPVGSVHVGRGGCLYGCNVYARRNEGKVITGIFHSSSYGHAK